MEAKEFLIRLQQDEHRGYSSIHNIRGVLRPAFQMATENDLIRKNPFEFQLADTLINDSVKRQAVTKKQMRQFLDFVKQEAPEYWEAIYILFHTGLRISEFCGLTLSDLDLRNKKLIVDHQLLTSVSHLTHKGAHRKHPRPPERLIPGKQIVKIHSIIFS